MKKILAISLALLTLCQVLCACADSTDSSDGTTSTVVTAAPAVETTEEITVASTETEKIQPNVGDVTFNNYVFRVLTRGTSSSTWYSRDIYS